MTEAAVQIRRFVYVEQLGTYTHDTDDFGKTYIQFSRFPEGDLLLMRVLIWIATALTAWKLCINVSLW